MAGHNRFAEMVRLSMKTKNNATKDVVTIRQLAALTGYSYEHCRKLVTGEPLLSREFVDTVSQVLGLDADEAWALAQTEKVHRKFGLTMLRIPKDARLEEVWPHLTDTDRERLILIAQGYAEANRVLAESSERKGKKTG